LKVRLKIASLFAFFVCFLVIAVQSAPQEKEQKIHERKPLKTSWQNWYPYQYLKDPLVSTSLTGLDVKLIDILAKEIYQKISYQPMRWKETIEALKTGELDFAVNGTYSKEREDYIIYSKPYRTQEDSLFILQSKAHSYQFKTVSEFLEYIKTSKFKLGVDKDIIYADQKINEFIKNPKNAKYIVYVADNNDSINKLIDHEIDGFFTDRMVGAAIILNTSYVKIISEHTLNVKSGIHLMFSKKTVSNETVLAFDQAIDKLKKESEYQSIISWYLYPVILLQTLNANWFKTIDILGTLFFSISGVLIARTLKASLFSAFIYAALPSVGGGLIRDVIFCQRPVDVLASSIYIIVVYSTVLVGFFIAKLIDKIEAVEPAKQRFRFYKTFYPHLTLILIVCDALGLAAFTVTGVMGALAAKVDPLWLWGPFFSFLTGAAGTIFRDILSKSKKLADIEGEIYSEVAVVWGLFLSIGLLNNTYNIEPEFVQNLVLFVIVGTFSTRLLVYFFKVPNVYFK
jgi:polar amino acid transport system substrate-binding protein